MWKILLLLHLVQLASSTYVGGSSMESTHFDRELRDRQCGVKIQQGHWITVRSQTPTVSNSSTNDSTIFRKLRIYNDADDRPMSRVSSETFKINSAQPLGIDQAAVNVTVDRQINGSLTMYIQTIECIECPYEVIPQELSSTTVLNLTLNTKFNYRVRIEQSSASSCQEKLVLHENGYYVLNVQPAASPSTGLQCVLTTLRSPNNIYIPLIVGGVILLVLFIACVLTERFKLREQLLKLKKRYLQRRTPQESPLSYDLQARAPASTNDGADPTVSGTAAPVNDKKPNASASSRSKRLLSLDAFRGLTLIAMIFVNYGSGGYAQFEHAPWHGITFADVVFPFFVWMLGTSLIFSFKNAIDKGASKRTLLKRVGIRTLKLLLIGFILNTRFRVDLTVVRFLGVLQRFAIVYIVVASIEILFTRPGQYTQVSDTASSTATEVKTKRLLALFRDILHFPFQWLVNVALAIVWILVVYLVPFENCPAGYLGPGGLHGDGKYEHCTGGVTGYIDRMIFTEKHLYQHPTCQVVYGCKPPFDPENLFGALPTIFLAFLGVQAGRILVIYQTHRERLIRLFSWSIVTIAIGVGLTAGTLTGGPMPLNKNLWTLSFSFFTAGLAFGSFSIMYILIDMLQWWNATPFQYPGMNSILIYITHLIFATYFPVQWAVADTHAAHLAMALWGCVFWIIVAYIFYRKRIFVVL